MLISKSIVHEYVLTARHTIGQGGVVTEIICLSQLGMKSIDRGPLAIDLDFAFLHERAGIFEQSPQVEAVCLHGPSQYDSVPRPPARDGYRTRISSSDPSFAGWYVDSAALDNAHTLTAHLGHRGSSVAA